ncbi:MAG: hypothetical protein V4539_08735 [Bacteroidota bacterium]
MKIIIVLTVILQSLSVKGQNPVTWSFAVKNLTNKTYEVHLTPVVQHPWHIYSQTSPEGGALPTTIRFNKNPFLSLEGKVKETGKLVSKYEEVFEATVKYFEGKVDFVQVIKIKGEGKTNLSGAIQFMACNNEQCLTPQTVNFNIPIH